MNMAEQFSPDLLGQHILAMRGDITTIKTDVAAIKDRLDHHQDELSVVSGLAMRGDRRARRLGEPSGPAQEADGTDRGAGASGMIEVSS